MDSLLFRADILEMKLRALKTYGEAQTRRLTGLDVINEAPDGWCLPINYIYEKKAFEFYKDINTYFHVKPRYHIGQEVYIKEACCTQCREYDWGSLNCYKDKIEHPDCIRLKWRSPLHMPEWAARHFAVITGVGIGRLQDITIGDCLKEGCPDYLFSEYEESEIELSYPPKINFVRLWNSLKPTYTWEDNPYVFVYKFKLKG